MKPPQGEILVFLDVDGVLNTSNQSESRQKLNPGCLSELKTIMDSVPGAKIVLSSAWRLVATMTRLLTRQLEDAGIPSPVGATGVIGARVGVGGYAGRGISFEKQIQMLADQRANEILQAVKERRPKAWIALDDLPLDISSKIDERHFVKTADEEGLTATGQAKAVTCLIDQIKKRDERKAAAAGEDKNALELDVVTISRTSSR